MKLFKKSMLKVKNIFIKDKKISIIGASLIISLVILTASVLSILLIPNFSKIKGEASYKAYGVGDEFCLDTECFYVLKDNGNSVTALAKYNLYVGYNITVNSSVYEEITKNDEGYGKQSASTLWANSAQSKHFGVIDFYTKTYADPGYWVENGNLKSQYGESYPAFVYDENSNIYGYVNEYKTYLSQTLGYSSLTATLMNYEQVTDLGLYYDGEILIDEFEGLPTWVYQTNYWLGFADSDLSIYAIDDTTYSFGDPAEKNWYGVRPVITVSKEDLISNETSSEKIETEEDENSKDKYNVGDEFCVLSECFYTIKDNGNSVTALAKYNLYVGSSIIFDLSGNESSKTNINSSSRNYGLQSSLALGYKQPIATGVISFGTPYWNETGTYDGFGLKSNYGSSYPAFVYDQNSTLYTHVQDYQNYFRETLGLSSVTATLLSYEQATELGCVINDTSCSNAQSFVSSTHYWLGSALSPTQIYVIGFGTFAAAEPNVDGGLRPVITISKSDINKTIYSLSSDTYEIDNDNKTVDVNGISLSDTDVSKITILPDGYATLELKNDLLNIVKDNKTIDKYHIINANYSYTLSSTYYTIDHNSKTIDVNNALLSNVRSYEFSIDPSTYKISIDNDKLNIKNSSGTIIDTYTLTNYKLYNLTSYRYTIDLENKTIDAKKFVIDFTSGIEYSSSTSTYSVLDWLILSPSSYRKELNDNKLEIKDKDGNIIDTYTFTNYSLYKVTSSYYTVNSEDKTIDMKNYYVNFQLGKDYGRNGNVNYDILSTLSVYPSGYTKQIINNVLEIRDSSNNLIDTYTFTNYKLYELTSSYYTVNNEDKTIDMKNYFVNLQLGKDYELNGYSNYDILSRFSLKPSGYTKQIVNNTLEIRDSSNNLIDTYTFTNYRSYELTSSYYTVNNENKTIDMRNKIIDLQNGKDYEFGYGNSVLGRLYVQPSKYTKQIVNNTLEIRDEGNNLIDTYTFTNYRLYELTSSYYEINSEDKIIDLKDTLMSNVSSYKFNLSPSSYTVNILSDKLEIKNGNDVIDTYTYTNAALYELTSMYYKVNKENKTIDVKGEMSEKLGENIWKLSLSPSDFSKEIDNDKLYIKDSNQNIIDTYTYTNLKEKDPNAYKTAGFNDKNLYTCAFYQKYSSDIEPNYVLTNYELEDIYNLECRSMKIKDTTGIEKLTNLNRLDLADNEIETINLDSNTNLSELNLDKNKLTNITLSNNTELETLYLAYNNINSIEGLNNLYDLNVLFLHNNNLSSIKLINNTSLYGLTLQNNPLTEVNMHVNDKLDLVDLISINSNINITYSMEKNDIVSFKDNKITALKEGTVKLRLSNENIMSVKPNYYDIAMEYVDGEYDEEEFEENAYLDYFYELTINVISDKDNNTPKEDNNSSKTPTTTKSDSSTTTAKANSSNTATTTKKSNVTTTIKKESNKQEDLGDIYVSGSKVSIFTLYAAKNKNRNIIVNYKDFKFIISSKDINNITGDLDLEVIIEDLRKTSIYKEVKDSISKGLYLSFNKKYELPYKIKVEINITSELLKCIEDNSISIYKYDKDLIKIAEDLKVENNKLSFYIDDINNYIITSEEIINKVIKDNKLIKENSNNKNYIWFIILSILILLVIGYIVYKREKKNN